MGANLNILGGNIFSPWNRKLKWEIFKDTIIALFEPLADTKPIKSKWFILNTLPS